MTLAQGARLGPYEILSALGAGGMGEVYKARDDRLGLDRIVAIKVLPSHVASDPDPRQRFEREARAVGALAAAGAARRGCSRDAISSEEGTSDERMTTSTPRRLPPITRTTR
jgi:serine/threonine protein kinase